MAFTRRASTRIYSSSHFLLLALWWGLLTGLLEGFLAPTYIWRDLMRAGVEIEPLLFLGVALLMTADQGRKVPDRTDLMRATFLFSALTLFACLSRSPLNPPVLLALLSSVAAASLVAFLWLLAWSAALRWQKRTLPLLLLLALWCIVGFPIKQHRHEMHDLARLPAAPAGAPNVLVIVVDTLRADHLSTYGYARLTSPHLTQLAAQGTLFEDAISPSSWTLPAHASLLTGLYPDAHHVDTDASLLGWHYRTLGEEFMRRGYRTAAFSANTLLFCRRRGFGRGFIHFEDDFQSWGSSFAQTFYGDLIKHLLFSLELKRDLFGRRSAEDINRHALRWIDSGHRPFFVFLNYMDVHDPYRPPQPYLHRYTNMKHPGSRASEHWAWFEHLTPRQRQGAVDAYDGAINYVDDHIQELMDQLRARGLQRSTVVVITSDHGESFGEHGLMVHGSSLYRELIHVPLILWGPGRIPAGKTIATPVSLTSLPVTLLEEAGETRHPDFPQPSLARLWSNAPPASWPDPISEVAQLDWSPRFPDFYGPMRSVTTTRWHYIEGGKFHQELFLCCNHKVERLNLATSIIGSELATRFEGELAANTSGTATGPSSNFQQARLKSQYPLDFPPAHLAVADFDSDGNLDVAVSDQQQRHIALFLGDGAGGFRAASHSRRILAGFARRGRSEATAAKLAPCRGLRNSPSCALALAGSASSRSSPRPALQARFTDVNGDGKDDMVLNGSGAQGISWLRAEGRGRFQLVEGEKQPVTSPHSSSISLARGDIDANRMDDFALADPAHDTVVFLVATRRGLFQKATVPLAQPPSAIALADLNHNGKADLVSISRTAKSLEIVLSSGSPYAPY